MGESAHQWEAEAVMGWVATDSTGSACRHSATATGWVAAPGWEAQD